jgi:hypothetical protein
MKAPFRFGSLELFLFLLLAEPVGTVDKPTVLLGLSKPLWQKQRSVLLFP